MIDRSEFQIQIELTGTNRLYVKCLNTSPEFTYAFSLFKDDVVIDRSWYSERNSTVFWLTDAGRYHVKVTVMDENQNRSAGYSDYIDFAGVLSKLSVDLKARRRTGPFHAMRSVLTEIWKNRYRMIRVAQYDRRLENKDSYLGRLWSLLNPMIQIGTFWFVFGFGIRGGQDIDGFPYILWMLCGLIPWFFINTGIVRGASSMYAKAGVVLKLKYPVATVPPGSILVAMYDHIMMLVVLVLIFMVYGYFPSLYWLNLVYYIAYTFIFLSSLALVTSTLTMVARDFQKLIVSLIRLLFYLTPILWSIETLPHELQIILRLNPILYIVNGFRDSLLYNVCFWNYPVEIIFFWAISMILLMAGCHMHHRFKDKFIDLL